MFCFETTYTPMKDHYTLLELMHQMSLELFTALSLRNIGNIRKTTNFFYLATTHGSNEKIYLVPVWYVCLILTH
mgnify:FL=1